MANPNPNPAQRWKPGQSGNPGGRPKGLEKYVRENCDFPTMVKVMEGIVLGIAPPGSNELVIKTRDRIEAFKVLSDRGHGKARVTIDVAADVNARGIAGINVDKLDDAAFDLLKEQFDLALENALHPKKTIDVTSTEIK